MVTATSRAANDNMEKSGGKITHCDKIQNALKHIRQGTHEQVAYAAYLSAVQAARRLPELLSQGLVKKTGRTAILSSGNRGEIWAIVENPAELPKTLFG